MLVGARGSGKSTMVDGIINYIMGVSFGDPFRLTMVTFKEDEKKYINQVNAMKLVCYNCLKKNL